VKGSALLAALREKGLKSNSTGLSVVFVICKAAVRRRGTTPHILGQPHRALQHQVCVLQHRARAVPAHNVQLGEHLFVCQSCQPKGGSRDRSALTLVLLARKEGAVDLRHASHHAVHLQLEGVGDVNNTP